MATPRKKYIKVQDSISRKPYTNDQLATIIRLMVHMNTRWAREGLDARDAGICALNRGDLCAITGKGRRDVAEKSMRSLGDVSETSRRHVSQVSAMSFRSRGDVLVIQWPKFAEYQYGWTPSKDVQCPESARDMPLPRHATRDPRHAWGEGPSQGIKESSPERVLPLLKNLRPPRGQPGVRDDEKLAWLRAELPIIDVTVADGEGTVRSLVMRYFRYYLKKGDREYLDATRLDAHERQIAERESEQTKNPQPEGSIPEGRLK